MKKQAIILTASLLFTTTIGAVAEAVTIEEWMAAMAIKTGGSVAQVAPGVFVGGAATNGVNFTGTVSVDGQAYTCTFQGGTVSMCVKK